MIIIAGLFHHSERGYYKVGCIMHHVEQVGIDVFPLDLKSYRKVSLTFFFIPLM